MVHTGISGPEQQREVGGIKHPDRHERQRLSQKRLTEVHLIRLHGEQELKN